MAGTGSVQVGARVRSGSNINEDTIRALVHGFYREVRRDALLGPVFEREIAEADWPEHLERMCDFWSSVLLKTDRYEGRPLAPHLRLPDISDAHFSRWLSLFRAVARQTFTESGAVAVIGLADRIAHSFRLAIAFHRGEDSSKVEPLAVE